MKEELKINSIQEYRGKYITEWEDGTITVSLMTYPSIEKAKEMIDRAQTEAPPL